MFILFQKRAVKAENNATKLKQENALLQVGSCILKALLNVLGLKAYILKLSL